jgi:GH15 family glucan-1,4-alpha-glucosidase
MAKDNKKTGAAVSKAHPLKKLIRDEYTADSLRKIKGWLEERGAHEIHPSAHGLFAASSSQAADSATGYQNVWIRDCVMIANSFRLRGKSKIASECARGLTQYFHRHMTRFRDIIDDTTRTLKEDVKRRPHIRFSATSFEELPEKWPHAQNDALGYALWLRLVLANSGDLPFEPDDWEVYGEFPAYFDAVEYWHDRDSGAWEESRKINSSSVAAVVAGLTELRKYLTHSHGKAGTSPEHTSIERISFIDGLLEKGEARLNLALPFEAPPERVIDSALLFLMYPLNLLKSTQMQDAILHLVEARLEGPIGIKRYLNDSYFCQDYDKWFPTRVMSSDFSDRLEYRDAFLQPGCEAQWCIFDPVISIIYGQRFLRDTSTRENLQLQTRYFNRSLRQVTPEGKCPELYYLRDGKHVVNAHTPLAWTQANQAVAMHLMEKSVAKSER